MRRSVLVHRVAFFETDAMGIVHHANYVRWLELARVAWMDEHDRPYRDWVAEGFHFATTRVEVDYRRAAAFDDRVAVATWLDWVGGASLAMAYEIDRDGERIAEARTEHALVGKDGRPRRLPVERRSGLDALAASRGRQREAARRAKTR